MVNKHKLPELIGLSLYFLFVSILALEFRFNFIILTTVYILLPALYLMNRLRKYSGKMALTGLIVALSMGIAFDYMLHANGSWYVNDALGIRVLNSFPLEDLYFDFASVLIYLGVYEYFFDSAKSVKLNRSFRKFVLGAAFLLLVFLSAYLINRQILVVQHFYLYLMLGVISLCVAYLIYKPKTLHRIGYTAAYGFFAALLFELVALKLGIWYFPEGTNVFYLNVLGQVFPLEELLYQIFALVFVVVIYEYFADNNRNLS